MSTVSAHGSIFSITGGTLAVISGIGADWRSITSNGSSVSFVILERWDENTNANPELLGTTAVAPTEVMYTEAAG